MRRLLCSPHILGGVFLFTLLCVAFAGAKYSTSRSDAVLTVTTTADSGPGSLRAALTAASDGDTIQFDPALNGQTISLASGELVITKNISINGPGSDLLSVSRSQSGPELRIIHIMPSHTVTIQGLTISGGFLAKFNSSGPGAGIYNEQGTLTLDSCTVSGNFSFYGAGGIASVGTLTVSHSAIIGNYGGFSAGGIASSGTLTVLNSTVRNNGSGAGGVGTNTGDGAGIYTGGMAVIVSSTIDHNRADGLGARGGGIYSPGAGSLTVSNSTISENTAATTGGAIYGGGNITNCTISGNTASQGGGNIYVTSALQISNTILNAGTSGGNIVNGGGTVNSLGYNISSDDGGGFLIAPGDQINADPMLGPLQNNGGPTFTHALLPGSPAINTGDPNFTPPPFTDQRGYLRVCNGQIDIGSFEVQPPPITISGNAAYCSNPELDPIPNVTLTVTGSASTTTLSDSSGNYMFSVPFGGSYTVTPGKAPVTPSTFAINTIDVVAVQRYFLNIGAPLSGCRLLAADVNGDSLVNTVDVTAIQRFVLALPTGTANVGNYQFAPPSRTYQGVVTNQTNQNYDTLVFGDVATPYVH